MGRRKHTKRNISIAILTICIAILGIMAFLTLSKGDFALKQTDTTEVIHKLKQIQEKGGNFELMQKDLDEMSSLYFGKPKTYGGITIEGANVEAKDSKLQMNALVKVKGVTMLLGTQGTLAVKDGQVLYQPANFKVGKIPVSKKMVLSQLEKRQNEKLGVVGEDIQLDPNLFPFKVTALKVEGEKLVGTAEKFDPKKLFEDLGKKDSEEIDKQLAEVEKQIQSAMTVLEGDEKALIERATEILKKAKGLSLEQKKKIINEALEQFNQAAKTTKNTAGKEKLGAIQKKVDEVKKNTEEKEKKQAAENSGKRQALQQVRSELSGAYGQVQTGKEKQIIGMMISCIDNMIANPGYAPGGDQAAVKSIYSTLDVQSKNRVKGAIFSNVSGGSIGSLRQAFGM